MMKLIGGSYLDNIKLSPKSRFVSLARTMPVSLTQRKSGFEIVVDAQKIRAQIPDHFLRHDFENLTWQGKEEDLSVVAGHSSAGSDLRRFKFIGAPYHAAVHVINNGAMLNSNYCQLHSHPSESELNVIIPSNTGLIYRVFDGYRWSTIKRPAELWIKPGLMHAALATQGSGVFFVVRFPDR